MLIGAFTAIAALVVSDLAVDAREGAPVGHLAIEGVAMALALAGAATVTVTLARARRELAAALEARRTLERRAHTLAAEAAAWREQAASVLRGLGEAIERQFEAWGLTDAEREVALLLLKGFGTREIAALRDTTDRTVRQQAQGVYAKSGLAGRAELSAFFLEDLLLPGTAVTRPPR